MGLRFRKSFKLIPGVRLNLSKSGSSWSFGRPGATINFKGRRVRTTVGIPGTGLSYSEQATLPEAEQLPPQRRSGAGGALTWLIIIAVLIAVFTGLSHH